MRLFITAFLLAAIFFVSFGIWGEDYMRWFTGEAVVEWIRAWGAWGWLAIIALLMSDLALPVPATPVMTAAGYIYGPMLGGLISATGSFCAGLLGYGLCRAFGRETARRFAGERELEEHETLFQRSGPWLVAASRWLPLLPEVVSCLAGLTRMPFRIFAAALACGSLPLGFVYAAIGAAGQDNPRLALGLSIIVPPILWLLVRPLLRRHKNAPHPR